MDISDKKDNITTNNLVDSKEKWEFPPTNDLSMDLSSKDHSMENNLVCMEESYVIPTPPNDLTCLESTLRFSPPRLCRDISNFQDASGSDDCLSDGWQELNKSDYAKVIFCDLYYHADSGAVGCKFQITDNVHEDPCDYVGLIRIGYENLTQCLVTKMLSETECEEDGKLLRCDFSPEDLPDIEPGFYQFLYITRDKEICGASMPVEIRKAQQRDLSPDCIITEKGDNDFLLVRHGLEKKNQLLEELLAESQAKNRELAALIDTLTFENDASLKEKEVVIESLQKAMLALREELNKKVLSITESNNTINSQSEQIATLKQEISSKQISIADMSRQLDELRGMEKQATALQRVNQNLSHEVAKLRGCITTSHDQDHLTLMEQLDDQKFMIRALEDSKQLALKEMNDLAENLSRRTTAMNNAKIELENCRVKVKELQKAFDKQTEDLEDARVELSFCKLMKEPAVEIQQTEEVEKLTAELGRCQQELQQARLSEANLLKDLETVRFQLSDFKMQLEDSQESRNKLAKEVATLATELGYLQNAEEESVRTLVTDQDIAQERLLFIRKTVKKRIEELEDAQLELAAYKLMKEPAPGEIQQIEELGKLRVELFDCQEKLKISSASEIKLARDLKQVFNELNNCKRQLEQSSASENELSRKVVDLANELGFLQGEAKESAKLRKIESYLMQERVVHIREAMIKLIELGNEMDSISLAKDVSRNSPPVQLGSSPSHFRCKQEVCRKKCEILAYKGKIKDVEMILKKATNIDPDDEAGAKCCPCKVSKKCLKKLESRHSVPPQDIDYMNHLTERIKHRETRTIFQVETVSGSEMNNELRSAQNCLDRILRTTKDRLWNSDDWSKIIDGYEKQYVCNNIPLEVQIEMILAECRSQYEIEILLEVAGRTDSTRLLTELLELKTKHALVNESFENVKVECKELQDRMTQKEKETDSLSTELQELKKKHALVKQTFENVKVECKELQDRLTQKEKETDSLSTELLELKKKHALVNETFENVKVECKELQERLTQKEKETDSWLFEVQSKNEESQAQAEQMKAKLEKMDVALKVAETAVKVAETAAVDKDNQVTSLSDKLCNHQSKSMQLTEELQDLRMHYGELHSELVDCKTQVLRLKDDCMKKDALVEFLKTEKGNLSSKQMELQETVNEHAARLTEAAELYKQQFKEIEKLKKKLKKIQTESQKLSVPKVTADSPVVVLNDESKTSPVHEVFYPARSSSDSDTGEHVSGESTRKENKGKCNKGVRPKKQHIDENANQFKATLTRTDKKCETTGYVGADLHKMTKAVIGGRLKRDIEKSKLPHEISPEEMYQIPCPSCDLEIQVSSTSTEALTNHLDKEHQMNMCPICGCFFPGEVPERYLAYHIEGHFQTNEKNSKD